MFKWAGYDNQRTVLRWTEIDGPDRIAAVAEVLRNSPRTPMSPATGIGAAMLDVGTESDALNDFDDEDGPFLTWQLRAGVQWQLSERVALNAGYRFLNIDDAEIDDDIGDADFDLETQQHVIDVGLSLGL